MSDGALFLYGDTMTIDEKIAYNQKKATKDGWTPDWFGCSDFDSNLIDAIMAFQKRNNLDADGMCGSGTFRVLWTEREQEREYHQIDTTDAVQTIIFNDKHFEIFWDKVITWNEKGGEQCVAGSYSSYASEPTRRSNFFVTHWDVCLSSSSCFRVLKQRGISVHFGIDNDGTIYQWLDLQHAAWHAGGRSWNHNSVGVEVSNAYDLKYQSWYRKQGFGDRPILDGVKVHGTELKPFLGFYDTQLKALAALWEAVSWACNIPLELPKISDTVDSECVDNTFKGFCNHYHLKSTKIDCAGLDNQKVLKMALELRKRR